MPKNDNYGQGTQYPVLSDAADIEIAFSTLVNGFVPKLVMRFADANARAAALTGPTKPVPGMITYLIAEDRWEGRQADNTWLLLSDGPWQPLTYKTGFAAYGGSPGWRKKAGGGIELRGRIKRSNNGNLDDSGDAIPFASIPSSMAPAAIRMYVVPSKRVTVSGVTRYTARLEVHPDGTLKYMVEAGGGTGTSSDAPWFGMDGVMFSPDGD
ncbi:hypothetical protein ACGFZB_28600 [Streptomyces cinerochromogenes]|uniref:Uncharacterized protein n=1 Tax=Streptomyces cinerochromogenes TaxID=66422 RepID=A0ABW7BAS6_9ACTN